MRCTGVVLQVKQLTYRVMRYPSTTRITRRQVDQTVARAFAMWEEATDLSFQQRSFGSVNIEIGFDKAEHIKIDGWKAGSINQHAFAEKRAFPW